MWFGFDPEITRDLRVVRQLVQLQHQTPTREWPLVFVEQFDALLIVREWPDGSVTAMTATASKDPSAG